MADISKITLPNGDSYDIKDATARKGQAIYYATCSTAAGTAAKVATTTDGDFTLETGAIVMVKFTNASTYNGTSTLNVDSTGAKQIYYVNATAATRYMWYTGEVVTFVYDGTHFVINEGSVATTTYYGVTKLSSATNSTSEVLAATPKAVKTAYDLANAAAPQSTTYTKTEVDNLIGDAVDFGTVGSNQNPVYFNDGDPTPIAFTFGVDDDQNVQVAWDGDAPDIVIPTTTALAIDSGGTGATTAAGARTNLGLGGAALKEVVSAVQDDDNLVTNGAVKRYVDNVNTTITNETIPNQINAYDGSTSITSHSVSGSVLSFNATNAQPVKSLVLNLEPTQSGTGDPSPSNIRPISGYDAVNVTRAGKNLYRYPYANATKTQNGITWTDNGDGSITVNGTATATEYFNLTLWDDDYVPLLRTAGAELTITGGTSDVRIFAQYREAGSTTSVGMGIDNGSGVTFTVPNVVDTYNSYLRVNNGVTVDNVTIRPMIRLASITDDTYKPYQGTIYPISLASAGTVYGGTLDVTTGELTIDKGYTTVGDITWSYDSTYTRFSGSISDIITGIGTRCTPFICSAYQSIDDGRALGSVPDGSIYGAGSTTNVYIKDTRYTASATFKSEMSDVQIVYPLATPITYHLTPIEITTLLGENTIWMDASGTINLTYEDVVSSIKYAEVGELGTAAVRNANDEVVPDDTLPTGAAVYNYTPSHAQNGIYYGTCATAAGTAAKVIELVDPTGFELKPGVMIAVAFEASNTADNETFNVEGTGAIGISYIKGTRYTGHTNTITGHLSYIMYYIYDGTYWCFVNNSSNYTNNSNTVPSAQCETAAGTAAKTATCTNHTLTANTYLHFNIRYSNTVKGAITMNVDSSGAKPIYINGGASSSSNYTLPAGTYIAFYNGTNWYFDTNGGIPFQMGGGDTGNFTTAASADSVSAIILREIAAIASKPSGTYTNSYDWVNHVNGYSIRITKEIYVKTTEYVYHGTFTENATYGNSCKTYSFFSNGTDINVCGPFTSEENHIEKKLVTVTVNNTNVSDAVTVTWDSAFSSVDGYIVIATQNVGDTIFNGAVAEVNSKSTTSCTVRLVRPSATMSGSSKISVLAMEI